MQGTVKWFDSKKGYGFITPDDGSSDIFVHVSELKKSNIMELCEGDRVSYTIGENKGKVFAGELQLLAAS